MTKSGRRLDRLQSAIGPERNALVWLQYFQRNEPLPPSFWKMPDAGQVQRLTSQVVEAYAILGLWTVQTDAQTSRLESMFSTMQLAGCVLNWGEDCAFMDRTFVQAPGLSNRWPEREKLLQSIVTATSAEIATGWNATWENLRTAELVAEELGADFSGRDVLDEDTRTMLTRVGERLESLKDALELWGVQVEPREPTSQTVQSVLAWIRGR